MTYSEVREVSGNTGDFTVSIAKRPRYINESLCTGCGECTEKCPGKVPDEFNLGLAQRKSIYFHFAQAVPRIPVIDPTACLMLTKGKCGVCQKKCGAGAIDFKQTEQLIKAHVGAIVVATGFDIYDATLATEYGFGRIKNVISSLQYERLISASGPSDGHLNRPSDGKPAHKMAYVLCVGSRDVTSNNYCSALCCMYAAKDAMLAREHDAGSESFVFYTDTRCSGKGFWQYFEKAQSDYGVNFIRGRVSRIIEDQSGNPVLWYEDTKVRRAKTLTADMVVLANAVIPARGTDKLAAMLGIKLDRFGFIATDSFSPTDTTREGIFAAGCVGGPRDIAEAVAHASAAAARAAEAVTDITAVPAMGSGS